jgi:AraC-like DNA-binding protein
VPSLLVGNSRHRRNGDAPMREARRTLIGSMAGVRVEHIECHKPAGAIGRYETQSGYGLLLVRRGGIVRWGDGRPTFIDSTSAAFERPSVEYRIEHIMDGGDVMTAISLTEAAVCNLTGDATLPDTPINTTPALDVQHRQLALLLNSGIDPFEIEERLARLIGGLAEQSGPGRLTTQRRPTEAAHRRIVERVRQAIAADPARVAFGELADELGYTRFHVVRTFKHEMGITLSQHRNRIRATNALERLAGGERDLAAMAEDLGFADQSHMAKVLREAYGDSPGAMRRAFSVLRSEK